MVIKTSPALVFCISIIREKTIDAMGAAMV
jgi:hypothetical protein